MNNKWYSLTRPAVVQFNPPRDTWAVALMCGYLWGTMVAMGIVLIGALLSDWLVVRLQTTKQFTIGQLFTWRIMPLVFSAALNVLFATCRFLALYYDQVDSMISSIMPFVKLAVLFPTIPMAWCLVRGIAFSSLIPGKRRKIAVLVSIVIILLASRIAQVVHFSILFAYVEALP